MAHPAPINSKGRIREIDIIRGFALFGVLWLNLETHGIFLVPEGTFDNLITKPIDEIIGPIAKIFISSKAMTLFSLLFGYGFAMIMERFKSLGVDAEKIFLRRTFILLCLGMFHILFVWFGDILHVYALMGFLLYLTRNWSNKTLLIVGLVLALFSEVTVKIILHQLYEEPFPWWSTYELATERHFVVLQGNDYFAYLGELWWAAWNIMWTMPSYIDYCLEALGRFMIGAWIFRQGWIQNSDNYAPQIKRFAMVFISVGLLLSTLNFFLEDTHYSLAFVIKTTSQLVLAMGYGALIISLHKLYMFNSLFNGLSAVGRTALSNYLLQTFLYLFVLFGFGLGLLDVMGATLCLLIAVSFFFFQIILSSWWIKRFRFGPAEWLWRSLTYRKRQPFRMSKVTDSSL